MYRPRRIFKNQIVIIAAVIVLLLFLHFTRILQPLENVVISSSSPVLGKINQTVVFFRQWSPFKTPPYQLLERNQLLEKKYRQLLTENTALANQIAEMKTLESQLRFLEQRKLSSLFASVIGTEVIHDTTYLITNRGSNDGVKVGLPVLAEEGIILGKISFVTPGSSHLLPLTHPGSHIAGSFTNQPDVSGIVSGDSSLTMKMELIPQEILIQENDTVITSGTEPGIPAGLVIGEVIRVEKDENNFFQTAFVRPLIISSAAHYVSIILNQ